MNKRITLALLFFCQIGLSQQLVQDQRIWFSYLGQYKVSDHWGYHIDAQFRFDNQFQQNVQNVFRVGGIFFLSTNKNISGGYALINTFDSRVEDFFKENRLWEQFQYNKKWSNGRNIMSHRLRLEQRWVGAFETNSNGDLIASGSNYQNRFRYQNKNMFHLANLSTDKEEIYAILQDEIMIIPGNNKVNANLFDQNRFSFGIGLNYHNNIRLELGYINQMVFTKSKTDIMNHNVLISLIQNLDLQN